MAENTDVEGEGEEKKSSKKIIIIAVAVLLLGGGAAGYFFMVGDSTEVSGEQAENAEQQELEESKKNELYTELEKPLVVNFPKGSAARLIQVSLSLLVEDEETVEALKKHQPMIRNNLLMAISAQGSEKLAKKEGKQELRAKMLEEVSKIMTKMTGKNKVSNIFFTTFVMQ